MASLRGQAPLSVGCSAGDNQDAEIIIGNVHNAQLGSTNIRKKRNYKGLKLPTSAPAADANHATTIPSLTLTSKTVRGNSNGGADRLTDQLHGLELDKKFELEAKFKLDLHANELRNLQELGSGAGGTVYKVLHQPTGMIMAKKVIPLEAKPEVRKQILREMQFLQECNSKNIIEFYGAFLSEGDISICMEFMDAGSLDSIYKNNGPIPVPILAKITASVLHALTYLYDKHRIIHRDVKPSNVLVNTAGCIKICDFGVSGQLNNSIANTFVGTSWYMSVRNPVLWLYLYGVMRTGY